MPSEAGLYNKYAVFKAGAHCVCQYYACEARVTQCFVLRPNRDPAALAALKAYASHTDDMRLRDDLENWIRSIETGGSHKGGNTP